MQDTFEEDIVDLDDDTAGTPFQQERPKSRPSLDYVRGFMEKLQENGSSQVIFSLKLKFT
jgi:hypothetical protein